MMLKKISVLLVVSMLVMTSIIIVTNNHDVRATQEPEKNNPFDYQLIHNVTTNLSERIIKSYDIAHGELAKGRYFGSTGEHDAADFLAWEMGPDSPDNISLFDPPDIHTNTDLPYRQKIEGDYNTDLEINYRNLTLHHGNETTYPKDFYITPEWGKIAIWKKNITQYPQYLNHNTTYTDLQIVYMPNISKPVSFIDHFFNATCTQDFFNNLVNNATLVDENQFDSYMTTLFENYYNFTFEDILQHPENATRLPWYNETQVNDHITSDYLGIFENPDFNPNESWAPKVDELQQRLSNALNNLSGYSGVITTTNEMEPWWLEAAFFKKNIIARILYTFPSNSSNSSYYCRGLILFDSNSDCFDSTMNTNTAIPFIYINGTLGNQINQSTQDYRISYTLNQSWNDKVESYNVIGQINGTDQNHTAILGCLYDSMFTSGAADSAIGCGMVLAFAKYMKYLETNLSIIPKENVRFILYGGEEPGVRGAYYYEQTSNESITTVIDLNQLGFDQRDPHRNLTMNAVTNKLWFKFRLDDIINITDYQGRKNDGTSFKTSWTPFGSWSDDVAFASQILKLRRLNLTTAMFLKDFNWTRHHHDGENHTKGDTMDFYNESDIKLTMEMIWNVTRFFLYQPDCWFENVTYTYTDGDDQNPYNDTVNASFTLHTRFPEDKVTVKLILVPTYLSNPLNPAYPILYRYQTEKTFLLTPDGTSGSITMQLPKGAPNATYAVHLILLNSTGTVLADTFGKEFMLAAEVFSDIYQFLQHQGTNSGIDYIDILAEHSDEISNEYNINIMDLIQRFPLLESLRDLITSILTIHCFSDDQRTDHAPLSPPNDPPSTPEKPDGPSWVSPHEVVSYTTRATDPDGDQIEYKWRFHFGDLFQFMNWTNPTASGEYNTQSTSWDAPLVPHLIFVKARDTWHSPNVQSGYSEPKIVLVGAGIWFTAPAEQLVGAPVQFNAFTMGMTPSQLLWDMGLNRGWTFGNQASPTQTYTDEGTYNVTLKVTDENQQEHLFTKPIEIKYMISNFSAQSGNTNTSLWFNDTSLVHQGYHVSNWTWEFGDGNISYGQANTSHTYATPGVYNVSLTVKDEYQNCYDVSSRIIYLDDTLPVATDVTSVPIWAAPEEPVVLYADVTDAFSGVKNVSVNISLPDSMWQIVPMEPLGNGSYNTEEYDNYDFTCEFTDTEQIGDYFYSITAEDNAGNTVEYDGFSFVVSSLAYTQGTPYHGAQRCDDIPIGLYTSLTPCQHYAFVNLNNDVVVWMPMDATVNGDPLDVSGYENNAVGHGGVSQTENGFFGKGFQFDGTNDYLEIASNSSLAFNSINPMTWSLWVRPGYSVMNKTMGILSKACSNGSGFTFCLNTTSNDAQFVICKSDKGRFRYSNKVDLEVGNNTWAHLTIVYNGSSGWDVYVNESKRGSLFFPVVSNTNMSYLLGAGRTPIGNHVAMFFKGTLDDVVMFTRGLGVDEIKSLYNASAYPYAHNFTGVSDDVYNFTGCAGYLNGYANRTETRTVLIDTQPPVISGVSRYPAVVGFGGVVQVNASVVENGSGLLMVGVNISYPNATSRNVSMTCIGENTYRYNFSDTWCVGRYNYSVWAVDNVGNMRHSSEHSFNTSVTATMSVASLKDSYSGSQYINITDPPNPPQNLTVVGRGLTWNTYYNDSSGCNILESYQGPVNYLEDNKSWTPINNTLFALSSDHPAYNYGYRTGNTHGLFGVYFKPDAQNSWPVAFAYSRSNDPTINVVRSKLVGVGYVDPASNWSTQYLQSVKSSQGQVNGNTVTYPGVFTGTDVAWSYGNTGLKEAITLSNATKAVLQSHPPSSYGLHDTSSYFVFITKLDYQNLNVYNDSGMLTGNVTVSDKGVEFRDALGYFKCALPLGDAYEMNNESVRQKLTYRIVHLNGDTYLLSGLKVSDLNSMMFPVVIDPTLSITSITNDGYIYNRNTNYNTAWTASTGTISSTATYISIGQDKVATIPSNYDIYRGYLLFNTSSLPSNAIIDNATLSLYKKDDYSVTDFTITIQNGQPAYPHSPLQSGDYNKNYYSGSGGTYNTSGFHNGYNNVSLTQLGWIVKGGTTKFCLRSSRDINAKTPTGNEYVNVYANDKGSGYQPKLVITYRNQSKIKNTGSTAIKGYLLIQVQYYNSTQGKWLVEKDTINETSPRTINGYAQLALDTIFNGHVRTNDLHHNNSNYRVYAVFRDPYQNILRTNDGKQMVAWWQFIVNAGT